MSQAFLEALKKDAESKKAGLFKRVTDVQRTAGVDRIAARVADMKAAAKKPEAIPVDTNQIYDLARQGRPIARAGDSAVANFIDPNGTLQAAGLLTVALPAPDTDIPRDIIFNASRNRIDVYFPGKPSAELRATLKRQNFWYDDQAVSWYHADTEDNREFLRKIFGLDIPAKDVGTPAPLANYVPVAPAPDIAVEVANSYEVAPEESMGPGYERFRAQVDDLIRELKIAPADLMLVAINALHKRTFSRDS